MQCINPLSIPRPGGEGNKDRVVVPCGQCFACLTNRREEWAVRLLEEQKANNYSQFLTLTYDDKNLTYGEKYPTLVLEDLQKFIKRLRKKSKFRYYAVGEYGTKTQRPHYHLITFSNNFISVDSIQDAWSIVIDGKKEKIGNIYVGTVTIKSCMYVTKYHVNKGSYPSGCARSFTTMSRRPGIGSVYLQTKKAIWHSETSERNYYQYFDKKKRLPRYYRERLFTEGQREDQAIKGRVKAENNVLKEKAEYLRKNPDGNWHKYKLEQIVAKAAKFKEKSNFNNKF